MKARRKNGGVSLRLKRKGIRGRGLRGKGTDRAFAGKRRRGTGRIAPSQTAAEYNQSYDAGFDKAYNEGFNVGYAEGMEAGHQEAYKGEG
ncbi:hypothetical protein ACFW1P_20085 [Paenibacillus sp. NPDC058910]|uniref:hypothetical protein n=1 Tax=Paenibacillus TaxID=44249 RepID=UPI00368479F8